MALTSVGVGMMIGCAASKWVGNDCPREDSERRRMRVAAKLKADNVCTWSSSLILH